MPRLAGLAAAGALGAWGARAYAALPRASRAVPWPDGDPVRVVVRALERADQAPQTHAQAQRVWADLLDDPPPMDPSAWHDALLRLLLQIPMEASQCDRLVAALLERLWATSRPVALDTYQRLLRRLRTGMLPHTLHSMHVHVCAGHLAAPAVWHALLRHYVQTRDWTRMDEMLQRGRQSGILNTVDEYHYTLLRLQRDPGAPHPHNSMDVLLKHMQQSGLRLNDAMLVRLLRALAAPVRHASLAHVGVERMAQRVAPVQSLVDAFFVWLCHHDTLPLTAFRRSLAHLLELELQLLEAQHAAVMNEARRAHRPCSPFPPRTSLQKVRAKLAIVADTLRGDDGLLESVEIAIHATSGQCREAAAQLQAWIARDASDGARARQRRALVHAFSQACRHARTRRLVPMLHVLAVGAEADLWRAPPSPSAPQPATTLVRLWTRFAGAWTHLIGVRRGRRMRARVAQTPMGWSLLVRALQLLARTAENVPATWAPVWNHPERCRALSMAAHHAPESLSCALERIHKCLRTMQVPDRIVRSLQNAVATAPRYP